MEKKSFWARVFCFHPAYRNIKKEKEGRYRRSYRGHSLGEYTTYIITKQCVSCGHEYITHENIWDK